MHGTLTVEQENVTEVVERKVRQPFVSIIIPTLNEAGNVERLAEPLSSFEDAEIIFSDGGSTDSTVEKLEEIVSRCEGMQLVHSQRGRNIQMNAGAKQATGDWLIFLHADTILPEKSFRQFVQEVRATSSLNSGAFEFRVDHRRFVYRYLELYVRFRSKVGKLPYGDQAIFVKRDLFEKVGGYRSDYPLMEDMEFVQRLNKQPGFRVLDVPVYTSARRFESEGYLKRTCGNLYLQLLYTLGKHPRELAKLYWQ